MHLFLERFKSVLGEDLTLPSHRSFPRAGLLGAGVGMWELPRQEVDIIKVQHGFQ